MQYYERLKATREDKDIPQRELAEAIGTSQAQIWKYESGKQEMTVLKLREICLYMNVSADYILGLPRGLHWPR